MAEKYPIANGNWSTAANWNGGTKPTTGDTAHANGFTVTLDEDVTCDVLTTASGATASAGGEFDKPNSGSAIVLTCDIVAGSSLCIDNNDATNILTIIGDIYGGWRNGGNGTDFNGAAGGDITGNIYGGDYRGAAYFKGIVVGDVYAATGNGQAALHSSSGNIDLTGNCFGGADDGTGALHITSSGTADVTGSAYAGTSINTWGIHGDTTGDITLSGTAYSGEQSCSVYGSPTKSGRVIVKNIDYNGYQTVPIEGKVVFNNTAADCFATVQQEDRSELVLADASGAPADHPATDDVGLGVSYDTAAKIGTKVLTAAQVRTAVDQIVDDQIAKAVS